MADEALTREQIETRFVRSSNAAKLLRLPQPRLYQHARSGELDTLLVDGVWLFSRASIRRFIAKRERTARETEHATGSAA